MLLVLNNHVPTGLKFGWEVEEERLWKRKEWEFRMKYLWWKCEKGGSKDQKARTGGGEHQGEGEKKKKKNTGAL